MFSAKLIRWYSDTTTEHNTNKSGFIKSHNHYIINVNYFHLLKQTTAAFNSLFYLAIDNGYDDKVN